MLSVQCLFSGTNFKVQLIQLLNTSESIIKRLSEYDYMYFRIQAVILDAILNFSNCYMVMSST